MAKKKKETAPEVKETDTEAAKTPEAEVVKTSSFTLPTFRR